MLQPRTVGIAFLIASSLLGLYFAYESFIDAPEQQPKYLAPQEESRSGSSNQSGTKTTSTTAELESIDMEVFCTDIQQVPVFSKYSERLELDIYVLWIVADPAVFDNLARGNETIAGEYLDDFIYASLRYYAPNMEASEIRSDLFLSLIKFRSYNDIKAFGIRIVDVRFKTDKEKLPNSGSVCDQTHITIAPQSN
jgi:hypothetical protein